MAAVYDSIEVVTQYGPSVVLLRCPECYSYVGTQDLDTHEAWHTSSKGQNSVLELSQALNSLTLSATGIGLSSESKKEIHETIKAVARDIQRQVRF